MTTINRVVNLKAGDPRVTTLKVNEANQGFTGSIFATAATTARVYDDNGNGQFDKGDRLIQTIRIPAGQERSAVFRTRRGETYVEFESARDGRVRMEGEVKQLFGVNTVTLSQDPITNPGNTPAPIPTPIPAQTVTVADPVMTVRHVFDPMTININVSGGVDIRYSGEVDVNHILSGKIGFDSILFSQVGTPCGC